MIVDRALVETEKSFLGQTFEKLDLSGVDLSRKDFTQCVFKGTTLLNTLWKGAALEDCVFDRCDLSNLRLTGVKLSGVDFKESKLIGSSWSDLGPSVEVKLNDCAMRYVSLVSINLRSTKFTRCSLVEATLVDVDLSKAIFSDCDFSKTLFERCQLAGADFSTSSGLYFDVAKNRAKGARVPVETAALVASALGLIVSGYA